MKRLLGTLISALLYLPLVHAGVRQARLPDHFFMIGKQTQPSLFDPTQDHSIFYVLVPAAAESAKKDTQAPLTLSRFTQNNSISVPASFFTATSPKANTAPVCVYFDWQDTSPSTNHMKEPAKQLAQGLDYLHSLGSKCIVVSQGRGSLVLNRATQNLKKSLAAVIQLGTPIPTDIKKNSSVFPHPNKIDMFYTFYSEQPFLFSKPSLHPKYTHKYPPITGLNENRALLLVNNKQPAQKDMYSGLVGKNLLKLCYEMKKQYQVNRDLWTSLSPMKKETDLMVGIRTATSNKSLAALKEIRHSNKQKKLFTTQWKRAPEMKLSSGARTRSLYRYKKS
jgi:hypothetical protein